jgi:hypothetical protein
LFEKIEAVFGKVSNILKIMIGAMYLASLVKCVKNTHRRSSKKTGKSSSIIIIDYTAFLERAHRCVAEKTEVICGNIWFAGYPTEIVSEKGKW